MATKRKTTKKAPARKRAPRRSRRPAEPVDALDVLCQDDRRVIALMLWLNRFAEPDLYAKIDRADLEQFEACVGYLGVRPTVNIKRPQGRPAEPPMPPSGRFRGSPGREAEPPKDYVIVTLTDEHGNRIAPVESDEQAFDKSRDAATMRSARDRAPDLVQHVLNGARTGETSLSDIQDLCDTVLLLSRQ